MLRAAFVVVLPIVTGPEPPKLIVFWLMVSVAVDEVLPKVMLRSVVPLMVRVPVPVISREVLLPARVMVGVSRVVVPAPATVKLPAIVVRLPAAAILTAVVAP